MVRFGAGLKDTDGVQSTLFQFQYGAIWSFTPAPGLSRVEVFQFQYGAIWSRSSHPRKISTFVVSIPVWCDLESTIYYVTATDNPVSIPVWCDLELQHRISISQHDPFQFQYGAIWRIWNILCSINFKCVSIPVWCDLETHSCSAFYFTAEFQFQYGAIWRWLWI